MGKHPIAGCTCADARADIVCAPAPSFLIPKGLLGVSCIVQALREAVEEMDAARCEELQGRELRLPRRKILQSLETHWHGLTLFIDHPQIPIGKNGAERAVRPAAIARKNFYGSGVKWSGELMAMLMRLFQPLSP